MSTHGEPMSGVDHAWLQMENDSNLMISGVMILEAITRDALEKLITERLLKFAAFDNLSWNIQRCLLGLDPR